MAGGAGFDKVKYFIDIYGKAGLPEPQAIADFIECENREIVRPFQAQLLQIAKGECDEEHLIKICGMKRKVQYGSYQDWAKVVLALLTKYKQ